MSRLYFFCLLMVHFYEITTANRSLMIGGELASVVEFPFMVKLKDNFGRHKCGGTLITPDTVLTAAHCLKLAATVERTALETYRIKKAIEHPQYSRRDVTGAGVSVDPYDVGLIFLDVVQNQGSLYSVQLNNNPLLPQNFADLLAVGWNTSDISEKLLMAQYKYVPNSACIETWGQSTNRTIFYRDRLIDASFCSVPVRKKSSVCSGDAGAPILLVSNASALQVAVVAGPIDCGSPALALLSVRISSIFTWIERTVCLNSRSIPAMYSCHHLSEDPPKSMKATTSPHTTENSKATGHMMASTFTSVLVILLLLLG